MATSLDQTATQDWTCQRCGAYCFASKNSCFKCGAGTDGSVGSAHRRREGLYKPATAPSGDKTKHCKDCGIEFVFTAKEQAFFLSKGFLKGERVRCTDCVKKKKQAQTAWAVTWRWSWRRA